MNHNVSEETLQKAQAVMGKEPVAALGSCFISALRAYEAIRKEQIAGRVDGLVLVHGIGIASMPGQEGNEIVHAWLEFTKDGNLIAYDPIWDVFTTAEHYATQFKTRRTVKYNFNDITSNIIKSDTIDLGPWDSEILAIAERAD
jgi:hypothetical protein